MEWRPRERCAESNPLEGAEEILKLFDTLARRFYLDGRVADLAKANYTVGYLMSSILDRCCRRNGRRLVLEYAAWTERLYTRGDLPTLNFEDLRWFVDLLEAQALKTMEDADTAAEGTWEHAHGKLETHEDVRDWLEHGDTSLRRYAASVADLFQSVQLAKGTMRLRSGEKTPVVVGNCMTLSLLAMVLADLLEVPMPHFVHRARTHHVTYLDNAHRLFGTRRRSNHLDQRKPNPDWCEVYSYDLMDSDGRAWAMEDFLLYPVMGVITQHLMAMHCDANMRALRALMALFESVRELMRRNFPGGRVNGCQLINHGLGELWNQETWLENHEEERLRHFLTASSIESESESAVSV